MADVEEIDKSKMSIQEAYASQQAENLNEWCPFDYSVDLNQDTSSLEVYTFNIKWDPQLETITDCQRLFIFVSSQDASELDQLQCSITQVT